MSYDSEIQESLKKELDELIAMAESSAASINTLVDARRQKGLTLGIYLLIAVIPALLLLWSKELRFGENLGAAHLVLLFLALLSSFLAFACFLQFMKLREIGRDLNLERSIYGKLVSLIDDQFRRMESGKNLSIVMRATIDNRIKRLDRTVQAS